MTTTARNCAVLAITAGIIGAAALGLAGMAHADPAAPTTTTIVPAPVGPGYQYYPDTYASPAQ